MERPGQLKFGPRGAPRSSIEAELGRIERALREPQTDDRYCQLYAAQQALAWAMDPASAASPYVAIQKGKVQPLMLGTPVETGGYLADPRPIPS